MKFIKTVSVILLAILTVTLCSSCGGESAPAVTPTPVPTHFIEELPVKMEDVQILVNPWNPIPESYGVTLRTLDNGQTVSDVCYESLKQMLDDCAVEGYQAEVCSGYRNIVLQTELYENKVSRLMQEGYSRRNAERVAATEVAVPGTSEHHTGLAVDIVDASNGNLDETQAQMPAQQWLMANCYRYGFILRYPEGKSEITGIIYEPWHYRYVGAEAAKIICEEALCLEEYLAIYQ